jgi:putative serine protease PepD
LPPPSGDYSLDAIESENVRIYKQAAPAVANIVTRTVEYDFFFNAVPTEGAGSGFLIDANGHILTNYHVVEGAQTIEVVLGDQSRYKAKFIGADQRNDIALIQIDTRGYKLTPLTLGDSRNLIVGQRVLAIGNPFGFQSTLTTGVVSSLGRTVQTGDSTFIDEAIQTDASINRGNSGGPLLNSHGEVIGINSAIFSPSGTAAGIGFAIPINTARRVAEDLITRGRVRHASLGAEGLALWPDLAEALNLPVQQGLLIERVEPGGAAAKAGIRGGTRTVLAGLQEIRIGGDVLIAVNGKTISNQTDLSLLLNRSQPGDTITLTILRDGKKIDVPVKLGDA